MITAIPSCSATARQPAVFRARHPQGARERLEHRLHLVVARPAVHHLQVDIGARGRRETLEEVLHQFRLQVADANDPDFRSHDGERPARKSMAATASVSSMGITK